MHAHGYELIIFTAATQDTTCWAVSCGRGWRNTSGKLGCTCGSSLHSFDGMVGSVLVHWSHCWHDATKKLCGILAPLTPLCGMTFKNICFLVLRFFFFAKRALADIGRPQHGTDMLNSFYDENNIWPLGFYRPIPNNWIYDMTSCKFPF